MRAACPTCPGNAAVNGGVPVYTSFFPSVNRVGWHIYGGTSAGSPQVAGVIALANEQQRLAGQPPLGFINPLLNEVGSGPAYRDILPVIEGTAESGKLWITGYLGLQRGRTGCHARPGSGLAGCARDGT